MVILAWTQLQHVCTQVFITCIFYVMLSPNTFETLLSPHTNLTLLG